MILSVLFFSLMDILIKITDEYDVGSGDVFKSLVWSYSNIFF